MSRWLTLGLLLWAAAFAVHAQAPADAPPDPAQMLEAARKDMDAVRAAQDQTLDEAGTLQLRKRALSAQTQAQEAAAALTPELEDVQARLAQLGKPADGVKESADVARQRSELMAAVSKLDSQIKLARLMAVEAEQAAATALESRRSQLGARLGEHGDSVLGARFWRTLARDGGADLQRLSAFGRDFSARLSGVTPGAWLALAGAIVVLLLVHVGLQRGVAYLSAHRIAPGRLRRSLYALGVLLVRMLTPGLIGHFTMLVLSDGDTTTNRLDRWLHNAEAMVWFGGFVYGLGAALLMPRKPSWRLAPIADATAARLQWFPAVFASTVVLSWACTRLVAALDASDTALWAVNGCAALVFIAVLSAALGLAQRRAVQAPTASSDSASASASASSPTPGTGDEAVASPLWLSLLRSTAWVVLGGALLALLIGFVALASFVVNQLVWALIVLSAAYLVAVLVDDVCMWLLKRGTRAASESNPPDAHDAEELAEASTASRTRAQAAVLMSGTLRVLVGVFAVVLLLAPFGEGPVELFARAGRVQEGLSIGELSLRPMSLLQGVLVLVFGLLAVRLLKQWLSARYMPTTRMDAGMRLSVTTLFGYMGAVAVIAAAMSAVGVGLERVAWVASALSVGIGFGLQAVVQNFVSGLILLAERPVKVGDWVALSGVEGDIRRINVRATEIQMGDRSTVIVPNSEFITKIVRNVTYGESLGMVQFKLPMPLATDLDQARTLILAAFQSHSRVLSTPAPNVQMDGIAADGTSLILNASGFVDSPRAAYGVKSDLLFDVLKRLREAGLLVRPPTVVLPAANP
ncbi:DUF3772 domain-containing protein [Roseateles sp. YR242]|uniref:DUF3772 domain-containing protein n=1 Tax=Roseateles sp. YR242 TaxID=1855305 RepID=UPI0015A5D438|nr:DUF3772 domain-containing protein [Roseateles sp. YR242]